MRIIIFFGVCSLLAAKLMLLVKILWTQNCVGISGKTQVLYAIIFITRYLDVTMSYYNCPLIISLLKIFLIILTNSSVLSIYFFYNQSYQSKCDNFRIERLIFPCIVLSLFANYGFSFVEIFWAFSIYLESISIIPQMHFISKKKKIEKIVYYYISTLSACKIFYLMDAVQRFYMDEYYDKISLAGNIVQLMFYCDFFLNSKSIANDIEIHDENLITEKDNVVSNKSAEKEVAIIYVTDDTENTKEALLFPSSLKKNQTVEKTCILI